MQAWNIISFLLSCPLCCIGVAIKVKTGIVAPPDKVAVANPDGFSVQAKSGAPAPRARTAVAKPNVLFLVADDFGAALGHLQHPLAKTPNLDKLAASGSSFSNAHTNHPICQPSRASFMTGILGRTSKNFAFDPWYDNEVLKYSKTIPMYFQENGYRVIGTGKINHDERATPERPTDGWDEYGRPTDYGPIAYDGKQWRPHPNLPFPLNDPAEYFGLDLNFAPLSVVPFTDIDNGGWVYGRAIHGTKGPLGLDAAYLLHIEPFRYVSDSERDLTPDELNAQWAADWIQYLAENATDQKPFFLGVGFVRPHTPIYVPDKYYDRFPLADMTDPENEDDEGTNFKIVSEATAQGFRFYQDLKVAFPDGSGVKRFMQAYLAGVAATDDNAGKVLDALDSTHLKENTIVIFIGDHGFSLGSHGWLYKHAPWDAATQVPFIVRAPGVHKTLGSIIDNPVSLVDIYPTLKDLCGLEGSTTKSGAGAALDGFSVRPFLEGQSTWDGPDGAVTGIYPYSTEKPDLLPYENETECKTHIKCNHWTLRTKQWRYTRYNDGSEELYDHSNDPAERKNLASDSAVSSRKRELRDELWHLVEPSGTLGISSKASPRVR